MMCTAAAPTGLSASLVTKFKTSIKKKGKAQKTKGAAKPTVRKKAKTSSSASDTENEAAESKTYCLAKLVPSHACFNLGFEAAHAVHR
jgi:hypothetical protein